MHFDSRLRQDSGKKVDSVRQTKAPLEYAEWYHGRVHSTEENGMAEKLNPKETVSHRFGLLHYGESPALSNESAV